jgi:hypothetical protein
VPGCAPAARAVVAGPRRACSSSTSPARHIRINQQAVDGQSPLGRSTSAALRSATTAFGSWSVICEELSTKNRHCTLCTVHCFAFCAFTSAYIGPPTSHQRPYSTTKTR